MLVSFSTHQNILNVSSVISVFGNGLLISLILHRRSRVLGAYRWLLLSFAIVDIIISLYHAFALPTFYQIEFGFVLFTWPALHDTPAMGFVYNTCYCLLFYEPFVLLTFHFIYRYVILVNPNLISRYPYSTVLCAIAGNILFSAVIVYDSILADLNSAENFFDEVLLAEFGIDMKIDPPPNIILINYFHSEDLGGGINWNSIAAVRNSSIVSSIALAVNAFCSLKIRRAINTQTMTSRTKALQTQLFRALVVQFAIPFFICFLPFSAICLLPLTGIRFGETGNVMGIFVSSFPAVDPFMVLFMIGRFRAILADWIRQLAAIVSGQALHTGPASLTVETVHAQTMKVSGHGTSSAL